MLNLLRRISLALLGLLGLVLYPNLPPVFAQEGAQEEPQINLAPIETAKFPQLTSYLDVRTGDGEFVSGLGAADFQVVEDGMPIPVSELSLLRQGAQFALAVSPGSSFTIRDAQGLTRYDHLLQALQEWVTSRPEGSPDDLSFLTIDGPEITHVEDAERWMATIESYQVTGGETLPGFDALARAIEVAADQTSRSGMGRAVLFITPPPEGDVSLGLQSLAARAAQRGVRIYIWMVASSEVYDSPGAAQLVDLASQTGGAYFAYSGIEAIPNLEDYLEPFRSTYFLAYPSRISTSGIHKVRVEIQSDGLKGASSDQEFELQILAPSVAFVSPPTQIQRSFPSAETTELAELTPSSTDLEILIEFPDGYVRPLVSTTLLVDGASVDVNTAPPFDRFTWDLMKYSTSGTHSLRVEALDTLGIMSDSMDVPIAITIEEEKTSPLANLSENRTLVAGLVVVMAGAVLALVLVLGGRLRPGTWRAARRRRRADPVTQPVQVKSMPAQSQPRRSAWINRIHLPQRAVPPKIYALLVADSDSSQGRSALPIPISKSEVSFGHDPHLADQIIDDPSIEGLHAHLIRAANGSFRLTDAGSIGGTWVNFTPISQEGVSLEHGDLIHFGRVGFRFQLREPKQVRKPVLKPKEPGL